jgi:nitric oxide reductase activation protein
MPAAGAPGKGDGDEDGDDKAPGASGAGGASGSDQDDDDGEDAGGGGDDSEADEAEGDDPATTGSQPDDGDDSEDKPDDDGAGDADGGQDAIDDLAQRLANALNQRASDLPEADEAGDEADGAGDGAGELGNLDAYDDREVVEVPEDLLRDILEALQAELEDISEPVADILAEDPRMVAANVQRAQYDSEAARKVTDRVTAQVAEIRRVFDRQKDAATGYLRGQERGKIDGRMLWKVGVGQMNVRKRRIVRASPEMAVGLLLDVSGSMEASMPIVLETGAVFAEGLAFKRGVNFAAWTYTGGRNEVALTRICDRAMGKLCLGNIVYGGGTPSGCAIAGVKVLMDRMPEARKMLIHFTDGQPDSLGHVHSAVKACRDAGIGVYSIGQGARLASTLEAQYGKGNWETIDQVADLPSAVGRLLQRLVTAD